MGAGQDWRRANRVLHLQCHVGRDSLILAQRGARVVGLDFSEPRKVRVDPSSARCLASRAAFKSISS